MNFHSTRACIRTCKQTRGCYIATLVWLPLQTQTPYRQILVDLGAKEGENEIPYRLRGIRANAGNLLKDV